MFAWDLVGLSKNRIKRSEKTTKLFHQAVCCDNDAIWPKEISSVNPALLLDQISAHNG